MTTIFTCMYSDYVWNSCMKKIRLAIIQAVTVIAIKTENIAVKISVVLINGILFTCLRNSHFDRNSFYFDSNLFSFAKDCEMR